MIPFLKKHPFAVEAFFESSIVLTFAAPKDELQRLIPECLTLDTFQDRWAFVAVALVQTKALRPKGFPKVFGNDFFLIGYRVFVRYTAASGKRLRGLFILKSETDKKKMAFFGNLFTKYSYTITDIVQTKQAQCLTIKSLQSQLEITVATGETASLPSGSPFANWKEARHFAGPLPYTFTYDSKKGEVLIIEGVRQHWHPQPVVVHTHEIGFLKTLPVKQLQLANAFSITKVPYYWKQGKTELWNG